MWHAAQWSISAVTQLSERSLKGTILFLLFWTLIHIINTYRTAVSPTLDLLCHEDFNVGRSEAESNIEIFMAQ